MAGFFPSVPAQVNFDLSFAPVNGQWRLFGISVGVGSSAPAAPAPVAETKAPAADPRAAGLAKLKSATSGKPAESK
jgi:hypothetical protein